MIRHRILACSRVARTLAVSAILAVPGSAAFAQFDGPPPGLVIIPGGPMAGPAEVDADPVHGIQSYDRESAGPVSQTFRAYQPYAPAKFYRVPGGRKS